MGEREITEAENQLQKVGWGEQEEKIIKEIIF